MRQPAFKTQAPSRSLVSAMLLAAVSCLTTSCSKKDDSGGSNGPKGGLPGFTLVQQLANCSTDLIDMEGRVVHRWACENPLGGGTYLLENGNLLRSSVPKTSQRSPTPGLSGLIELLDWDGNRLWSYKLSEDKVCLHHDIELMPNGNILMLVVEQLTASRPSNDSPTPVMSLMTSVPITDATEAQTMPSTPPSAQDGTKPGAGGCG